MVTDQGRMTTFVLLMGMAACQLACRSLSFALLLSMRSDYLLKYYVTDVGLFFVYKLARGDFRYSLRMGGLALIFVSFLLRLVIKVTGKISNSAAFKLFHNFVSPPPLPTTTNTLTSSLSQIIALSIV